MNEEGVNIGFGGDCRDWSAWHEHRPSGPPVLHVRGECQFPSAGYSVELRRSASQGMNPKELLLDRVVSEPDGPAAAVITVKQASYCEETDFEYDMVTVLPDGVSIRVQHVT